MRFFSYLCTQRFVHLIENMKKQHYILLALCPVVCYLIALAVPNYYTSRFIIARESEKPISRERILNIQQPTPFDLGIGKTESAVDEYGYEPILHADEFIAGLFDTEVKTLDGRYDGSCYDYYRQNLSLWQFCSHADQETPNSQRYSREQVRIIERIRKSIRVELNYETRYVTVSYTAKDPLVATRMAEACCQALGDHLVHYEQEKMNRLLGEVDSLMAHTESTEVRQSYAHQRALCEIQTIAHPSFVVLSSPSVDYRKAGPKRGVFSLLATLLLGLGVWGWKERKQIIEYLG